MALPFEPPSGEQFELRLGAQRAVVVEVGGGLREYGDILLGYGPGEMCSSARGQVLVPWPNRVKDGAYEWEGRRYQLPVTEVPTGAAIHGLVRWASWHCVERSESRVSLAHVLHPQPGYTFTLRLRVEYELGPDGLTVRTCAENIGERACPFGAGHHPYIRCDVDALFGDERIDDTRRWDGSYEIAGVTVWADDAWPYVQLFSGDLPDIRRRGFAVEPMTCPPNAFNTGEGLLRLEPGETFQGRWGISP
jgi:aldose 1-epimerase